MKVDWDELKRLHEAATAGEWLVFAEGKLTDLHIAGNNSPIVHWIGFDGSDRPRTHNRANAKAIAALHNSFPAILAEREAAQKSMMLLTQSRDRCIAENVRLAERLVKLDPGNCFPMKLNAAFDKETQNEG